MQRGGVEAEAYKQRTAIMRYHPDRISDPCPAKSTTSVHLSRGRLAQHLAGLDKLWRADCKLKESSRARTWAV